MKKKDRRKHAGSDCVWELGSDAEGNTFTNERVMLNLLADLRAVMHDILDEQKETNRVLRVAFGVDEETSGKK